MCTISIIVIGLNEERFLETCLQSAVKAISHTNHLSCEIIYVDAGSTDQSIPIAKAYADKVVQCNRVTFPSAARNRGIEHASGEYIQFLDGDMEIDMEWLNRAHGLVTQLEQFGIVGVCGIRDDYVYRQSDRVFVHNIYGIDRVGYSKHFGGGLFIKKSVLLEIGCYNPKLRAGEEPDLHARLLKQSYFIFDIPCGMIIHHNDNTYNKLERFHRCWKVHFGNQAFGQSLLTAKQHGYALSLSQFYISTLSIAIFDLLTIILLIPYLKIALSLQLALLLVMGVAGRLNKLIVSRIQYLGFLSLVTSRLYQALFGAK